eukprot:COSAG01_NODE_1932_length_8871_cov_9.527984_2_plen_163_part_00
MSILVGPVDFQHPFSEKSARDFSRLPRDLFAKKNSCRKFFRHKILEPVLFHNLSAQNPAAGRDPGSAAESEFLLPRKHAPLPKNVNTLKSVPARDGDSRTDSREKATGHWGHCRSIIIAWGRPWAVGPDSPPDRPPPGQMLRPPCCYCRYLATSSLQVAVAG